MTRSHKLDNILDALLYIDKEELDGKTIKKEITLPFINESVGLEMNTWEMESLKQELLYEEYVLLKDNQLRITDKGKKFITREGGYSKYDEINLEEKLIRKKTIEKFRYDKISFWLSIIAVIISLLGLFLSKLVIEF